MKDDIKIYTAKEFCERYHVRRATLCEWAKKGILKPIRRGGRVYYNDDCFVEKGGQK